MLQKLSKSQLSERAAEIIDAFIAPDSTGGADDVLTTLGLRRTNNSTTAVHLSVSSSRLSRTCSIIVLRQMSMELAACGNAAGE